MIDDTVEILPEVAPAAVTNDNGAEPAAPRSRLGEIFGDGRFDDGARELNIDKHRHNAAIDAADTITDGLAGALMSNELLSHLEGAEAVDNAIAWLESIANAMADVTVYATDDAGKLIRGEDGQPIVRRYRPVAVRGLRRKHTKDLLAEWRAMWKLVREPQRLAEDEHADPDWVDQMIALVDQVGEGASDRFLALLFRPEDELQYDPSRTEEIMRDMEYLTNEQILGGIYRFFISSGLSPKGGIRTLLTRLIPHLLSGVRMYGTQLVGRIQNARRSTAAV